MDAHETLARLAPEAAVRGKRRVRAGLASRGAAQWSSAGALHGLKCGAVFCFHAASVKEGVGQILSKGKEKAETLKSCPVK
jgi:hypothetical protein